VRSGRQQRAIRLPQHPTAHSGRRQSLDTLLIQAAPIGHLEQDEEHQPLYAGLKAQRGLARGDYHVGAGFTVIAMTPADLKDHTPRWRAA
jgi:hypothetical protein